MNLTNCGSCSTTVCIYWGKKKIHVYVDMCSTNLCCSRINKYTNIKSLCCTPETVTRQLYLNKNKVQKLAKLNNTLFIDTKVVRTYEEKKE